MELVPYDVINRNTEEIVVVRHSVWTFSKNDAFNFYVASIYITISFYWSLGVFFKARAMDQSWFKSIKVGVWGSGRLIFRYLFKRNIYKLKTLKSP